jgi:hypothetical protein
MTEHKNDSFVQEVSEWFARLDEREQPLFLELVKQGYLKKGRGWLKEQHSEIVPAFDVFLKHLKEELRDKSRAEVVAELAEKGLLEVTLIEAMTDTAIESLRFYFDADSLRKADPEQFEKIVVRVVQDYFIERRYSSMKSRMQHLELSDEQEVRNHYNVVLNLVHNFYDRKLSVEELEVFMREELRFDEDQIARFGRMLIDKKPEIDRYFLFRQLSKVMEMVEEAAASKV